MAHAVCPWWAGYLLASPIRRIWHNPATILSPFVSDGMTVFEPGPGMGFFTLELARQVGPRGKVIAIDIQPQMLSRLRRRAERAGLLPRVDTRLAPQGGFGLDDLEGKIDFALAFAVVHEFPDPDRFFTETNAALAPGGKILLAEPAGHVPESDFQAVLDRARRAGLQVEPGPRIARSMTAVLVKRP